MVKAGEPMRVAMYYANADVRVEEMPIPAIGPDEVLVKVDACGICGSDVMEWYRKDRVPLVLGHEIAGTIAGAGPLVRDFQEGDRVIVAHHVPCDDCAYCRAGSHTVCDTLRTTNVEPGGFADYCRVPAINVWKGLFKIPDNTPAAEASVSEALGCVLRGQRNLGIPEGGTVLVMGAGISGILHIAMARANGAGRVFATDISDHRKLLAVQCGAEVAIDGNEDIPTVLRELNDGRLADAVIVTAGAVKVFLDAFKCLERNAGMLIFAPTGRGVEIPVNILDVFWRNEVRIISSYGAAPDDYSMALSLIASRVIPVGEIITHRLGLDEIQKGFDLVAAADASLKVVIEPGRGKGPGR